MGAPLLHLIPTEIDNNDIVQYALSPFCPLQESFKASLTFGKRKVDHFIGQCIVASMKDRNSARLSTGIAWKLFRTTSKSKTFQDFQKLLQSDPYTAKKNEKEIFFWIHRYNIFDHKAKRMSESLDEEREEEMKEIHVNLYCLNWNGERSVILALESVRNYLCFKSFH